MNLMTIMYFVIQEVLSDPDDMSSAYGKLRKLRRFRGRRRVLTFYQWN